jgi:hypothetical protein
LVSVWWDPRKGCSGRKCPGEVRGRSGGWRKGVRGRRHPWKGRGRHVAAPALEPLAATSPRGRQKPIRPDPIGSGLRLPGCFADGRQRGDVDARRGISALAWPHVVATLTGAYPASSALPTSNGRLSTWRGVVATSTGVFLNWTAPGRPLTWQACDGRRACGQRPAVQA